MPTVRQEETLSFKIALGLIVLTGVLVPMQTVPGWAMIDLGWPPWAYYAVMAGSWAAGGALLTLYRVPGAVGGAVGGAGCLFAVSTLLANTTWTHSLILAVVGMLGASPGALVYSGLVKVQDWISPPPPPPPAPAPPPEPPPRRDATGIRPG
ncbi:MAG: hypothetical protein ACRC33_02900 [Gemmataceae bacterium]